MPITHPEKGRIPCPCCHQSRDYNFEKKTLLGVRTPITPGIFDSTVELSPRVYYCCVNCGWALGQPADFAVNKKATTFVEREFRLREQILARQKQVITESTDTPKTTDEPKLATQKPVATPASIAAARRVQTGS